MKPVAFEYCRPDTVDEVLALLEEFGSEACLLAGGMSLGAMLNMRLVRPAAVVDIKRVQGLDGISLEGAEVRTGATLRQSAALADAGLMQALPLLAQALPQVGHFQTRNRGTLGGSVSHADPSSEIPLCLLTLGGAVELRSRRGTRRVPAEAFFLDILSTARQPGELLTALLWPRRRAGAGYAFCEIAQRHGDFAIVACAVEAELKSDGTLSHLRFGLGGVESRPVLADTSGFLGRRADAALATEIAVQAAASAKPMADFKATVEYRRALIESVGAQALAQAFACAGTH